MSQPALQFNNQRLKSFLLNSLEVFKRTESYCWGEDGLYYWLSIVGLRDLGDLHHDGSLQVLPDAGQGHAEQEGGLKVSEKNKFRNWIVIKADVNHTTSTLMKAILIPWKSFRLIIARFLVQTIIFCLL